MQTCRLALQLFDGRIQAVHGTKDSLEVLREILVQLMFQHSEAIISHIEGGRPTLIVVPELEVIGQVESGQVPTGQEDEARSGD